MKTLKLITCIILVCCCSIFAQTPPTPPANLNQQLKQASTGTGEQQPNVAGQQPARLNHYMVEIPHTKDQCQTVMSEMKEKGPIGMRFEWGCASGEHVGFAMLAGVSEDAVRKQLPDGVQKMAKIIKVDRANPTQMQQMHK